MVLFLNTTAMSDLRLKEILEEKNMTLTDLSEKTGIEKGNLSAISNNKKNPTMETLKKIAEALKVKLSDLFEKKDSDIIGFLRVHGYLKQVTSLEDLKQLVEDIETGKI